MNADSRARFSKTVENYIRFRPGYPPDLLDFDEKHARHDAAVQSLSATFDASCGGQRGGFLVFDQRFFRENGVKLQG